MPYVKPIKPFGVNPALNQDRMNVIKVINGDTWTVDAEVWNPVTGMPATVETVKLEFVLSENRFDPYLIWVGTWFDGIVPDDVVEGLVHIRIPAEVSSELRRGIYAFSLKATDYLDKVSETELKGHFQVEYEPSSDTHDIPYRKMPEGNVYPGDKEDVKPEPEPQPEPGPCPPPPEPPEPPTPPEPSNKFKEIILVDDNGAEYTFGVGTDGRLFIASDNDLSERDGMKLRSADGRAYVITEGSLQAI